MNLVAKATCTIFFYFDQVGFLQKVFQGKAHHIRRIRKLASKNETKEWGKLFYLRESFASYLI